MPRANFNEDVFFEYEEKANDVYGNPMYNVWVYMADDSPYYYMGKLGYRRNNKRQCYSVQSYNILSDLYHMYKLVPLEGEAVNRRLDTIELIEKSVNKITAIRELINR